MNGLFPKICIIQTLHDRLAGIKADVAERFPNAALRIEYDDYLSTLRLNVSGRAWVYARMGGNTFTVDWILTRNGKREVLRIVENVGKAFAVVVINNMLSTDGATDSYVITTFENNDPETAEFIRQLLESQAAKSLPV